MVYRVDQDSLELQRGSFFTTLPIAPEAGEMALFDLDGFLLPGRWSPGADGNHILIPGYRIRITGEIPVKIVGLVVPSEDPPKPITDLPAEEYEHLFENDFPRRLAC